MLFAGDVDVLEHRHELASGSVLQDRNFGRHASEAGTDAASFQLSKTDLAVQQSERRQRDGPRETGRCARAGHRVGSHLQHLFVSSVVAVVWVADQLFVGQQHEHLDRVDACCDLLHQSVIEAVDGHNIAADQAKGAFLHKFIKTGVWDWIRQVIARQPHACAVIPEESAPLQHTVNQIIAECLDD